jgi:hypothetical protein
MKIHRILIGLMVCGCVSQPAEMTHEEGEIHIYYEELGTSYENLGRIVATSPEDNEEETRKKILSRAVELGADGLIIHFSGNRYIGASTAAQTPKVFQIEATAFRYAQ